MAFPALDEVGGFLHEEGRHVVQEVEVALLEALLEGVGNHGEAPPRVHARQSPWPYPKICYTCKQLPARTGLTECLEMQNASIERELCVRKGCFIDSIIATSIPTHAFVCMALLPSS